MATPVDYIRAPIATAAYADLKPVIGTPGVIVTTLASIHKISDLSELGKYAAMSDALVCSVFRM